MSQPCVLCDYLILDTAYACAQCGEKVAKHLLEGGELYNELEIAVTRQDRFGDPMRTGSSEAPLLFNATASAARSRSTVAAGSAALSSNSFLKSANC